MSRLLPGKRLIRTYGIEQVPAEILENVFKFLISRELSKLDYVSKCFHAIVKTSTKLALKELAEDEHVLINGFGVYYKVVGQKYEKINLKILKNFSMHNLEIEYNELFFQDLEKLVKIYGGYIPVNNLKLTPGLFFAEDFLTKILNHKPKIFSTIFNIGKKLELEVFYEDFLYLADNSYNLSKIPMKINLCHTNGNVPAGFEVGKILDLVFNLGNHSTIVFKANDERIFDFYLNFLEKFMDRFISTPTPETICKLVFHAEFAEPRWRQTLKEFGIPVIQKETIDTEEIYGEWLYHAKEYDEGWKLQVFGFDDMFSYINTWKIVVHNRKTFISIGRFDSF